MKHLDLFSGIGGFALAAQWAGFETVAFCEIEPFCQKVLRKNFGAEIVIHDDIRKIDGGQYRNIDLLTGGFPCQPYSVAGKRHGDKDPRALWGEMRRVIHEAKPAWIVGENVANFANMGLDAACADLENEGYEVQAFVIPAVSVGAWHRRYRCFIVANDISKRVEGRVKKKVLEKPALSRGQIGQPFQDMRARFNTHESRLCRSLYGIPDGVDRIKAIGNAVVPQQVYPILQIIADVERVA